MKNKIGVMQGRLLHKYQGRYQAHPKDYWQQEFNMAQEIGLNCIEFILDFNNYEINPLLTKNGIDEIMALSKKTGVDVISVCADFFMEAPLHSEDFNVSIESKKVLKKLLINTSNLGLNDVVLPCVDHSSLRGKSDLDRFYENIMPSLEIAEDKKINISLETDLSPQLFAELLDRFDSRRISVNYDIGNSAALGYDPIEELDCYGNQITDIHIKDRQLGGSSVPLGQGNANFDSFFNKLKEFNYEGPFIMQAFRDDEGVEIFKEQLDWVKPYLNTQL
jgi:L-ribulose-5-phosphate 3-epimerase